MLRLHGVRLAGATAACAGNGELTFSLAADDEGRPAGGQRLHWQTPPYPEPALFSIRREAGRIRLEIHANGGGSFSYQGDSITVQRLSETTGIHQHLSGIGLAIPLELRGVPCLHANGVVCGNRLVGLLGTSRAGKSTLATALCRRGGRLHTDDMIALHAHGEEWLVHPGPGTVRLWPDSASWVVGEDEAEALPKVHCRYEKRLLGSDRAPFAVSSEAAPLSTLYLLDRNEDGRFGISPLNESEALVVLMQESIIGSAAGVLGIEKSRFLRLARIGGKVPVRRLSYPSGYGRLDEVCALVESDS